MIRRVANKLGIDKAIFFTIITRIWAAAGGIITVLLVASCMTGIEQGFYYTFASILAIQVFFELGLAGIITQFVAHEKAYLTEADNVLEGDEKHLSRLAYLLRFCVKWYSILAIALVVIVTTVGLIFFNYFYESDFTVNWQLPWILLVIVTSLNFLIAPISAYIEGLGKVKEIAKIRLVQQIAMQICVWGGLLIGMKLYVTVIAPTIMALIFLFIGGRQFGKLLKNIYTIKITDVVSYGKEIFPYQWKIALSWISGYFIFQLFNPVLFATEGAIVAGQMGMTLTVINAVQALGLSWITTKVPTFSSFIATKNYTALDTLFNRTVKQMLGLIGFACLALVIVVALLGHFNIEINGNLLSNRFLPLSSMLFLIIAMIINTYVAAIATYLRCHKKEPFLYNSIVGGVLCMLSTLLLGKYFGLIGITAGFCSITVLLLPWGQYIYKSNKKKWH